MFFGQAVQTLVLVEQREVEVRVRVTGLHPDGLLVLGLRAGQIVHIPQDISKVQVGSRVRRVYVNGLAVVVSRGIQLIPLVVYVARVVGRVRVLRIQLQGPFVLHQRGVQLLHVEVDLGQDLVEVGGVRMLGYGLGNQVFGLLVLSLLYQIQGLLRSIRRV